MGHSIVGFIEMWSLYTGENTWLYIIILGRTCPSGLYRDALNKGCMVLLDKFHCVLYSRTSLNGYLYSIKGHNRKNLHIKDKLNGPK